MRHYFLYGALFMFSACTIIQHSVTHPTNISLPAVEQTSVQEAYFHKMWNEREQRPQPILCQILTLSGIEADSIHSYEELVQVTQKHWLRSGERWHIKDSDELKNNRAQFLECFRQLDMLDAVEPTLETYDAIGILGSKVQAVYKRTMHAKNLVERQQISASVIHMIAEERLFEKDEKGEEDEKEFIAEKFGRNSSINDEVSMMRLVGEKLLKDRKWSLIAAKKQPGKLRATTEDTIVQLAKDYFDILPQQDIHYLLISGSPHSYYQLIMAQTALNKMGNYSRVHLYIAGSEDEKQATRAIGEYLDALARIIFSFKQAKKLA